MERECTRAQPVEKINYAGAIDSGIVFKKFWSKEKTIVPKKTTDGASGNNILQHTYKITHE